MDGFRAYGGDGCADEPHYEEDELTYDLPGEGTRVTVVIATMYDMNPGMRRRYMSTIAVLEMSSLTRREPRGSSGQWLPRARQQWGLRRCVSFTTGGTYNCDVP